MSECNLEIWRRHAVKFGFVPVMMGMSLGLNPTDGAPKSRGPWDPTQEKHSANHEIPSKQPACDSCSLSISLVATIGSATDKTLIHPFASVDRDTRGIYYVGRLYEPGRVGVYDKNGAFVRTIGQLGQGPGEFSDVDQVRVGLGDTLFTIDNRNRRLTVWKPNGELVRSVSMLTSVWDVVPQRSGEFAIRGQFGSPGKIGLPLHLVGVSGDIRRSFGAINPEVRVGAESVNDRIVAPGGPGLIWSALRNQYRVELWDTAGKLVRSVAPPGPHWFTAWKIESEVPPRYQPRQPLVVGMRISRNTIWLLTTVVARDFKPDTPKERGKERPATDGYFDSPKYAEYMLEAINLNTGRVIGSTRITNMIVGGFLSFGSDDALYSKRQRADGTVAVEVWRLALNSPNSNKRTTR